MPFEQWLSTPIKRPTCRCWKHPVLGNSSMPWPADSLFGNIYQKWAGGGGVTHTHTHTHTYNTHLTAPTLTQCWHCQNNNAAKYDHK